MLTAADDGAGVPEGTLNRLFERFYRADAARSSRGTGLGLAIVKHIVVAAGGDVEFAPPSPRKSRQNDGGRPRRGALALGNTGRGA